LSGFASLRLSSRKEAPDGQQAMVGPAQKLAIFFIENMMKNS